MAHAGYPTRLRLVRALRGCLDRLPKRESDALILRYGVGAMDVQRPRQAARALHVSVTRFGQIHRRGLRNLVRQARTTSCENTPVAAATLRSAYAQAWHVITTVAVAAMSHGRERDAVAVLGVRRSGGADDDPAGDDPSGGTQGQPALSAIFGGLGPGAESPWLIALIAIMLAGTVWIIRAFVRPLR